MGLVIGLSGPTASGKSTFASALVEALEPYQPVLIGQDRYFRNWLDYEPEEREVQRTSNHPRAVLWDILEAHVEVLRGGGTAGTPVEGTRSWDRHDPPATLGPSSLVIVEGHLIYTRPSLRALFDLRLYVDAFVHERVVRRLSRDLAGGTTFEGATAWYRRDVIPNVVVHSERTRSYADLIIPFDRDNPTAVDLVSRWVQARLA
jgi:uridine kinase